MAMDRAAASRAARQHRTGANPGAARPRQREGHPADGRRGKARHLHPALATRLPPNEDAATKPTTHTSEPPLAAALSGIAASPCATAPYRNATPSLPHWTALPAATATLPTAWLGATHSHSPGPLGRAATGARPPRAHESAASSPRPVPATATMVPPSLLHSSTGRRPNFADRYPCGCGGGRRRQRRHLEDAANGRSGRRAPEWWEEDGRGIAERRQTR